MNVMFARPIIICTSMTLTACASGGLFSQKAPDDGRVVETAILDEPAIAPSVKPDVAAKPKNLGRITVADASKVSDTQLKAAVAKPTAVATRKLGKTVVSLGLLDETGFWLQTPLVTSETDGRVVYAGTGKTANIRLIPNGASSGSGSQMSIAAMQLLGIAITDIAEIEVFTR